jgi:DNA polymerase III sliding clamp (beta) subunit (PCNA family)
MQFNIEINARLLKAVALAATNSESRLYLRGVFVEFFADHITLTATDGHKLIAGRQVRIYTNQTGPVASDGSAGQPGVILPLEMVDKIKLGRKAPDYATLSFDAKGDNLQARFLQLRFDAVTVSGFEVEATYPSARKVCPQSISGEAAAVDPEIMIIFSKAAKLADVESTPVIHQNGLNPALVSWLPVGTLLGCQAFGVAMPMRVKGEYADLPDLSWFTGQSAVRSTSEEKFKAETERLKAKA